MSGATEQADGNDTYEALWGRSVRGSVARKVNTRGPRAVTWYHVHIAELKETAQAHPPTNTPPQALWALANRKPLRNSYTMLRKAVVNR
jgi:hypothetical protein